MQLWHEKNAELVLFEFNTEGCALSNLGILHENASVVILFDDTFGKRKSKSPSTLFSRIARSEDGAETLLGDAFTCVAYFYADAIRLFFCRQRDAALAFHRINGVLAEVLYHL